MMAVDRNDRRFFDFACSCSDEAMEKWEKVYEEVKAELEATDKTFTESVVFALSMMDNGTAYIEGIDTDMWSGIAVQYTSFEASRQCEDLDIEDCECEENCQFKARHTQNFWIECDRIHHGLARAYQLVRDWDRSLKKE
jgi:hypothetical protein